MCQDEEELFCLRMDCAGWFPYVSLVFDSLKIQVEFCSSQVVSTLGRRWWHCMLAVFVSSSLTPSSLTAPLKL